MGNLESACDNLDEAMEYFNRAVALRLAAGDIAAGLLAITYICIARVHYLKQMYEESYKMTAQSEALFVRTAGENNNWLAQYGNPNYCVIYIYRLTRILVSIISMATLNSLRRDGTRQSGAM
jgi:hypothetical protein